MRKLMQTPLVLLVLATNISISEFTAVLNQGQGDADVIGGCCCCVHVAHSERAVHTITAAGRLLVVAKASYSVKG